MKILYYFISVISLLLVSCSGNKTNKVSISNTNTSGMYLTHDDTVAVESLVKQFMTYYKDGKYADAAAMLYLQKVKKTEPQLLDNDEMHEVILMLKNNPINFFKISSMEFTDAEDNQVKCNVISDKGISLNYYFAPIRYLGGWRLCLKR